MRRFLPWLVLGPMVPAALVDLVSAPPTVLWLAEVVVAGGLGVVALGLTGDGPFPRLPGFTRMPRGVLGGALVLALLVQLAAAWSQVWFFDLAWGAVVLAAVLASLARSRADLALVCGIAVVAVLAPLPLGAQDVGLVLTLAMATAMSTAVGVGLLVRSQRAQTAALRRAVVTEERTSMARDLHDLVAHEVTGIIVLAQAAGGATTDLRARGALERIEASGHEALGQIRAMVQALRDDSGGAASAPAPALQPTGQGVQALRGLVADFAASSRARVSIDIAEVRLAPAADSAVQRLVAEALTNIRRHAAAATRVDVWVGPDPAGPGAVLATVVNDGAGSGGLGRGSGYGLIGVRERLAVVDGELVAGPAEEGRWVVEGRVPLEASHVHPQRVALDGLSTAPPPERNES